MCIERTHHLAEEEAVLDQLIKEDSGKRVHQFHPIGDPVTRDKPYIGPHSCSDQESYGS